MAEIAAGPAPPLGDTEELARRIFDSKKARKQIPPRVFKVATAHTPISVDRRTQMTPEDLLRLGDEQALANGREMCRGWAVIDVASTCQQGRTAEPSPLLGHPDHADINLNVAARSDEDAKEEWNHHLKELAAASIFLSREAIDD